MKKSQHVQFEKLADLAEHRLVPEEERAARAHLSVCPACSAQLARLGEVVGLMRADDAEDAPRDALAYVVGLFRTRQTHPSLLKRVVAALNFDSSALTPAFGVRSGGAGARQLLYTAGENDLDLRVTPEKESWVVSGQVLGSCAGGGRVHLEGGGKESAAAELNELCEFTLPPVSPGSYALRLRLADAEIEVPELKLG